MSTEFWIKRFLAVYVGAFVIIMVAQMLKGHDIAYSATQAAIWSALSALIFTIARSVQAGHNQHCAICKDTPEMQQDRSDEV